MGKDKKSMQATKYNELVEITCKKLNENNCKKILFMIP